MSRNTRKQIAITADLIGRTLHNLDELGLDYVVLIDGIQTTFTNVKPLHAEAIIERQYMINNKVAEFRIEEAAEKQAALPPSRDDGSMAH